MKSLEMSLKSSVEDMTTKLDKLLSFNHPKGSRSDEPIEDEQVKKLDNIDRKINMIAAAVGVRLRAKQEEDAEDRKRLKERLKEALMLEKQHHMRVDEDDRESWVEYIFGITKPNGRVGKMGSRCTHTGCWQAA